MLRVMCSHVACVRRHDAETRHCKELCGLCRHLTASCSALAKQLQSRFARCARARLCIDTAASTGAQMVAHRTEDVCVRCFFWRCPGEPGVLDRNRFRSSFSIPPHVKSGAQH